MISLVLLIAVLGAPAAATAAATAAAAAAPAAAAAADSSTAASTPRIGRIRIECEDVFADAERSSFLYRAADALHRTTRPSFVRRELLFAEGDLLDVERLRETERNLRQYRAFRAAEIHAEPAGSGAVDVVVTTRDAWSTAVGVAAGRAGGRSHLGFSGEEINLLGDGKELRLAADSGPDRTTREIAYGDPHLLGGSLTLDLLYASNSDGDRKRIALSHPFRSLATRWQASSSYDAGRRETRLYAGGLETGRFRTNSRRFELGAGRALTDPAGARVVRAGGGYRREEASHDPIGDTPRGDIPADRRDGFLFGRLDLLGPDFAVERNVNRLSRDEDFDLGTGFEVEAGYSPPLLGARAGAEGAIELRRGRRLPRGFAIASASGRTRYRAGRAENARASGQLLAAWRPRAGATQVLVARALWDAGWHLDPGLELAADGSTGLRGYLLHAFTGDRRLIFNLEERVVLTPEIAHLLELGAAAFADAGRAWPAGQPFSLADLRADAGVGLRLGLPRASLHDIWRIDLAYPLRPDLLGRQGWLVSFSGGQAF